MSKTVVAEKVAVVSKVAGDVLLQRENALVYNQTPVVGTVLENNDKLKVSEGFAALLLLDNQSQFKLLKNTEVRITMVQDLSGAAYHVRLDYGQTLTNYTAVVGSGFNVHTPTSVVSVKGTRFWTISDPDIGDNVIVLEGEVDVTNNVSGLTTSAAAGQTIRSTIDGSIQALPTDEDSIPGDSEDAFGAINSGEKPPPARDAPLTKRSLGVIVFIVMVVGFVLML
jgi:hypothetical protein